MGVVFIAAILIAQSLPILSYHRSIHRTGGTGVWSDAIYELVDFLRQHPERTVVCMDWGFNQNLLALGEGKIATERNYYAHDMLSREELAGRFDQSHWFLFHSPKYTLRPQPVEEFNEVVALHQARVDTVRTFYQRDGEEVYYLVETRAVAGALGSSRWQ